MRSLRRVSETCIMSRLPAHLTRLVREVFISILRRVDGPRVFRGRPGHILASPVPLFFLRSGLLFKFLLLSAEIVGKHTILLGSARVAHHLLDLGLAIAGCRRWLGVRHDDCSGQDYRKER